MKTLQEFRHYQLSESADGRSIEIDRSETEVVCLAFDTGRQFFVAMHVLAEDFEDRHEEEVEFHERANQAMAVRHPNVAVVYEVGEDEGTPYFVTEFIDGEALPTYLARVSPIPEGLALRMVMQLARGVAALSVYPELMRRCDLGASRVTAYTSRMEDFQIKLSDPGVAARSAHVDEADLCTGLARIMLAATGTGDLGAAPGSTVKELLGSSALGGTSRRMLNAIADGDIASIESFMRAVERCLDECDDQSSNSLAENFRPAPQLGAQLRSATSIERVLGQEFELDFGDSDSNEICGWEVVRESDQRRYRVFQLPPQRLCDINLLARIEQAHGLPETGPLVRVAAFWPDDGGALYAERVERLVTLGAYCNQQGGLSGDEGLWVAERVHEALQAANEGGFEIWGFGLNGIYLGGIESRGVAESEHARLCLRGHPFMEALTHPCQFSDTGVAPEKAVCSPDDYEAYVNLVRRLPLNASNPLMDSALDRFFEATAREQTEPGAVPLKREKFLADYRDFLDDNGLREANTHSAENLSGEFSEYSEDEGFEQPGVAAALFSETEEEATEGWNPIARSVTIGSERGDESDEVFSTDVEGRGGGLWIVLFILITVGATVGMLAYFFGWIPL